MVLPAAPKAGWPALLKEPDWTQSPPDNDTTGPGELERRRIRRVDPGTVSPRPPGFSYARRRMRRSGQFHDGPDALREFVRGRCVLHLEEDSSSLGPPRRLDLNVDCVEVLSMGDLLHHGGKSDILLGRPVYDDRRGSGGGPASVLGPPSTPTARAVPSSSVSARVDALLRASAP